MNVPGRSWIAFALFFFPILALAACRAGPPDAGAERGEATAAVSPAAIAAGMSLYMDNGCGVCHGRDGSGNGPLSHTLEPPPRDYRDPSAYKQGTSVAEIAYTIAAGVGGAGSRMPQYPHLSAEERSLIAQYIVSLQNR
jgi:mono/diheme cytochrome c family protein